MKNFGINDGHLIHPADALKGGFTSCTSYVVLELDFFRTAFTVEGKRNLTL
ncbi:hypothetical protein [Psychroflexus sp. MES1-P1E]|uniref:hypothetical protein n=1 Tax=Psychroflexus sp. MES1-P1E TaxID=2058320 RepID=UPI0015E1362D|nr:hypothetical protein [Psychroflexus sp. MES1-P1E]